MVQSKEYPDLRWMPPRSWTDDVRTSVQLIVIHTTEGHENATSAEDGAAYDQRRTDGTSAHYYEDSNSCVQCVLTKHISHTALWEGNRRGIHHELCGRAGQTSSQWADAASLGTLRQAAKQCARDAKKWGIPVRKLTVSQVKAGQKGFCGHVDITHAFAGDHTDPGPNFPWTKFLGMVNEYMRGEGNQMTFTEGQMRGFAWQYAGNGMPGVPTGKSTLWVLGSTYSQTTEALAKLDVIAAAVNGLVKQDLDGDVARLSKQFADERTAWEANLAELESQIAGVDENVLAALGVEAVRDPVEVAALLRTALGDQADAVFRAGLGQ